MVFVGVFLGHRTNLYISRSGSWMAYVRYRDKVLDSTGEIVLCNI